MFEQVDQKQVMVTLKRTWVDWIINPPLASNQGGCWKQLIRLVRRLFSAYVNDLTMSVSIDNKILLTIFADVQCRINSRLLTEVSCNPKDFNAITPNSIMPGSLAILQPLEELKSKEI